jgi:hypothetical protein
MLLKANMKQSLFSIGYKNIIVKSQFDNHFAPKSFSIPLNTLILPIRCFISKHHM